MVGLIDQCLSEASQEFELAHMKVNAVMEAAARQLVINYNEAELKVMQENGTTEDLLYLREEADNGLVETIIKAIKKIKEAIIRFCSDMKDKVVDMLTSKEANDALDKIEKKIKLFPLIGKKKIMVENYNAEEKCADAHLSKLNKLKAKLKSGQEVSTEEVHAVEKSFMEEHGKLIGVAAAVSVTVIAAIALYKKMGNDATSVIKKNQVDGEAVCDDMEDVVSKVKNPQTAQAIAKAATSILKTKTDDFLRCASNVRTGIKNAIKTHGTKLDASKVLKESTDDATQQAAEDASATVDKEMQKTGNDTASSEDVKTEDGYDAGVPDEEPDTDPWDDVMRQLDADDVADLADDGEDNDSVPELNDAFESAFNELFEDISVEDDYVSESSNEVSVGSKPSNEKIISDLFNEIVADVKSKKSKPAPLKESAFDSLMADIDNLN